MASLTTKEFIQIVYIDQLGQIVPSFPYHSFLIIGVGIELLGKCTDESLKSWDTPGKSKHYFEKAIKDINNLASYRSYLTSHSLYTAFRCGLAHSSKPDFEVTLSSKNELGHLIERNGRINLKIEDFYSDFSNACLEVMTNPYPPTDKMNQPFLSVPGPKLST
ncbi:MAG: hypothetical protein ACKV1O_13060 [Saprospiraceae bacterium]